MTEEWRDIPGYEGFYQVSNFGEVRSVSRDVVTKDGRIFHYKEKSLSPSSVRGGYQGVMLCKSGVNKSIMVHRLVAQSFLANPDNLPEVNHKDRNVTNNRADNLEWCTRLYNSRYDGAVARRSALYKKPVRQLSLNNVIINEYSSVKEASRQTGICRTSISKAATGAISKAGGFKWQHLDKHEWRAGNSQ